MTERGCFHISPWAAICLTEWWMYFLGGVRRSRPKGETGRFGKTQIKPGARASLSHCFKVKNSATTVLLCILRQDGWNWPDKTEETESRHESQASKALLDTPGMSPQPVTWAWLLLPNHGHAEIWGTLFSGVKALWATPHITKVVIFPFYTEKKWKSWAVILWLGLFIQSYLMNIQFLWFTSNPRKPSQWSLGESWLHRTTTLKHFHN